jgi:hypothetical protein
LCWMLGSAAKAGRSSEGHRGIVQADLPEPQVSDEANMSVPQLAQEDPYQCCYDVQSSTDTTSDHEDKKDYESKDVVLPLQVSTATQISISPRVSIIAASPLQPLLPDQLHLPVSAQPSPAPKIKRKASPRGEHSAVATPTRSSGMPALPKRHVAKASGSAASRHAGASRTPRRKGPKLVDPSYFRHSRSLAHVCSMGIPDSAELREVLSYCRGDVPSAMNEMFGR